MSTFGVDIINLPSAGALDGTEIVPVVQNGITSKTTVSAFSAAPAGTPSYVVMSNTSLLPNERMLSVSGSGLSLTDGGAGGSATISLNGIVESLQDTITNGIAVINGSSMATRSIVAPAAGITVTNGDGVSGNPTLALANSLASLQDLSGVGAIYRVGADTLTLRTPTGTANQITITNGDGVGGAPSYSITDNVVLPGTGGATLPTGTTAQRSALAGKVRFNSDTSIFEGYDGTSWVVLGTGSISGFVPYTGATTNVNLGANNLSANQITSTIATGAAPIVVSSTTLVPNLYVARAVTADSVTTSPNLTGAITSIGNATSLGSFTSAELATALTDETGSGSAVFGTSPTISTPVLNGAPTGTGVSSISSASTLVLRDANQNAFANNWISKATNVSSAGGTTVLTAGSAKQNNLTGSSNQTFQLPDATTLAIGAEFYFNNNSTGTLSVVDNGSNSICSVSSGSMARVTTIAVSTPNGAWDNHFLIPRNGVWSTAGLSVTGTLSATGHTTFEGVTSTGATGTGKLVYDSSPTLITPALGTPTALVGTNITGTAAGLSIGGNAATATTSTTATNSTNVSITDDTTTNATMYPTWVTSASGNLPQKVASTKLSFNPSTGTLTSISFSGAGTGLTGTASSLTAGNVTTNANLTGVITSVGNTTSIASQTGTGTKFVVDTSPTLITPTLGVANSTSEVVGYTSLITYNSLAPKLQSLGTDGASGVTTVRYSNDALGAVVQIGKSRATTVGGAATSIATSDAYGTLSFVGDNGTNFTEAAKILVDAANTVTGGETPGQFRFFMTADGATTSTERGRWDSAGRLVLKDAAAIQAVGSVSARLQVGTTDATGTLSIQRFSANATANDILFSKSRNGSINGNTIVQSGDELGGMTFYGNNGTTYDPAARIYSTVNGTPGSSADMPGNLVFQTTPDGSATLATRMTIDNAGLVNISGLTASSAVATDASKNLVSVTNTGTGNNVLAASPTLSGTVNSSGTLVTNSATTTGSATGDIVTKSGVGLRGANNANTTSYSLIRITGAGDSSEIGDASNNLYIASAQWGNVRLITVGAADSGGAGFRLLRVPNT